MPSGITVATVLSPAPATAGAPRPASRPCSPPSRASTPADFTHSGTVSHASVLARSARNLQPADSDRCRLGGPPRDEQPSADSATPAVGPGPLPPRRGPAHPVVEYHP